MGTLTACKPLVVEKSSQDLFQVLSDMPEGLEEYNIAECGCWNANGVPEMLR